MMRMIEIYLVVINAIAFVYFGIDKFKAQRNLWRIPEAQLLLVAVLGGSPGAYLGMKVFHHKTRKPKFYIGVPVIFMVQVLVGVSLYFIL